MNESATTSYGRHNIGEHVFDIIFDSEFNLWIATEVGVLLEMTIAMQVPYPLYPDVDSALIQFTDNLEQFLFQLLTDAND